MKLSDLDNSRTKEEKACTSGSTEQAIQQGSSSSSEGVSLLSQLLENGKRTAKEGDQMRPATDEDEMFVSLDRKRKTPFARKAANEVVQNVEVGGIHSKLKQCQRLRKMERYEGLLQFSLTWF